MFQETIAAGTALVLCILPTAWSMTTGSLSTRNGIAKNEAQNGRYCS